MSKNEGLFGSAFKATIPVLLGYSTIGIAFGLLIVKAGLPMWLAPVMSLFVYAGAAQFMAIGLLAGGTSIIEIAFLTLLVNARHTAYGLSLLNVFSPFRHFKPYLVFALTDESFGIISTIKPPPGIGLEPFYSVISALNQSYWLIFSMVGAIAGVFIPRDWTRGLEFGLTALFVVLLVEQIRSMRRWEPYALTAGIAGMTWFLFGPGRYFLLVATLAAVAGLFLLRKRLTDDADAH